MEIDRAFVDFRKTGLFMKERVFSYENDEIKVNWDQKRCIHAEKCVHGLPEVFDPEKKPWIQPDQATPEQLKTVIEQCPTGALHYEMKKTEQKEKAPDQNVISIEEDGPIYIHGNIVIRDMEGNIVLKDTRVAMCRCGASKNKPLCDNSHMSADFQAPDTYDPERLRTDPVKGEGGELSIKLFDNAPFLVEGNYTLKSETTGAEICSKKMSFCRCGGSESKPFCDGTHKKIGFTSD